MTSDNAHIMSNCLMSENLDWYAVRVRSKNEFSIQSYIENSDLKFTATVPSQKIWKFKNGAKLSVTKPILSSYVFMRGRLAELDKRLFFSIPGIFGLLSYLGKPCRVPEEDIDNLISFSQSSEPVYEFDYKKLKSNALVEVIEGPLKGAIGNFIAEDTKTGQLLVNLSLFKRTLKTKLNIGFIKPL